MLAVALLPCKKQATAGDSQSSVEDAWALVMSVSYLSCCAREGGISKAKAKYAVREDGSIMLNRSSGIVGLGLQSATST